MFQRLKGFNLDSFLESKIAEDEAKKAQQQAQSSSRPGSARRTPSSARRSGARSGTPSGRREGSRLRVPDGESPLPVKSPDPEEFVIGDDASDISRAATPRPVREGEDGPILEEKTETSQQDGDIASTTPSPEGQDVTSTPTAAGKEKAVPTEDELPLEVRRKLAKLDTLTTKYQDLLKNYRMAHSRVAAIEPFEAALREHTSLTSIIDPGALVEFLEARNLQKDMVMEELRRVSAENGSIVKERDELKTKLDDAEKKAKEAFDEAAGLRKEREAGNPAESVVADAAGPEAGKQEGTQTQPAEDETFFSYETELPRLEEEMVEKKTEIARQTEYINELLEETATLRRDYDVVQLDLSAMTNKVDVKEREISGLKQQLEESAKSEGSASLAQSESESKIKASLDQAESVKQELQKKLDASERKYQLERGDEQQEKRKQIQENLLDSVRKELDSAKEAKHLSEGRYRDLELEFNRISSECDNKGEIITKLRGQEDANKSLRERNVELERERDGVMRTMDSKKSHEAKAASLGSQLKRMTEDRDKAYQAILDCGKCQIPQQNGGAEAQASEANSAPADDSRRESEATAQAEVTTPSAEGEAPAGDAKKKNKKKKSKAKKKEAGEAGATATPPSEAQKPQAAMSGEQHIAFIRESLERSHAEETEEHQRLLSHHEKVIEERDQTIREHLQSITQKDGEISALRDRLTAEEKEVKKLNDKLKDQEALVEELDDLQSQITDFGKENTDFKHERKIMLGEKESMQSELEALRKEGLEVRRTIEATEKRGVEVQETCNKLQEELSSKGELSSEAEAKLRAELETSKAASTALEEQIAELKEQLTSNESDTGAKLRGKEQALTDIKIEKASLDQDLAAANSLAQTRFKDLSELREHSNKLQADLKKVKDEAAGLRIAKTELEKSNASLKKLEAKERDLRSEITEYKSQVSEKDGELASLRDKAKKSDERSTALEDTYERARKDLEDNEKTRDQAVDARDKAQVGLKKVETELKSAKSTLDDLQRQVAKFRDEAGTLRKELESKSSLLSNSQSLAASNQDQQREMVAQVKEHRDRADGLEEELADVHRLLSERGREGETMRRLVEDVKNERDRIVRQMQEERDRAIEERDRADDEATGVGRRKAKEIAELKSRISGAVEDAEKARTAVEDAGKRERDFRALREELERRVERAEGEVGERKEALGRVQDVLDECQRVNGGLEREKTELQKSLEERNARLEKVQKSSKALAEELQGLKRARPAGSTAIQSSRSSVDSGRVMSPVSRASNGTPMGSTAASGGHGKGIGDDMVNQAVIRSTLLNFLQQKDKRVQNMMVGPGGPLAKMLNFSSDDSGAWMAAVTTK